MENVGGLMNPQPAFWNGRRVLLTGHSGFKGSWLSLWLQSLGAEVTGISLAPTDTPSLFEAADVAVGMHSVFQDIRDLDGLRALFQGVQPEIVIHMAAQPLVLASYVDPVGTYATNVMGTVNVLEAARHTQAVRVVVNVTTDKCYENRNWVWGYREDEPMGGYDPYSNSKGCSELVTSAYRSSFYKHNSIRLASARAGNVIGGGDWAADRIVPDTLRAFSRDEPVFVRSPAATRPWQHVLEPLSGYLLLAERLFQDDGEGFCEGWNFGPRDEDVGSVLHIVKEIAVRWGGSARWDVDARPYPHEAALLKLDISKARARLGWKPRWTLSMAIEQIVDWHKAWLADECPKSLCLAQVERYVSTGSD